MDKMKRKWNWNNIGLAFGGMLIIALCAGAVVYANTYIERDEQMTSKMESTGPKEQDLSTRQSQERMPSTKSASSPSRKNSQASDSVSAAPSGVPTLTEFLRNALIPKDQVLYVWGGGWNEEDSGGNEESNSMGMADSWRTFFDENVNGYQADDHKYEIHDGLDCSGYVGWVLYNTFPEKKDYVTLSHQYDEFLSDLGYGEARSAEEVTEILPGDIMTSEEGHVYIALGQFEDGSILLLHSSPPGVRMSGTRGIAYETALLYQNNDWNPLADEKYLHYDQFRFNEEVLPDPDHLREMSTAQVVDFLYGDPKGLDTNQYQNE